MVDLGWLEETGHGVARDCADARRQFEQGIALGDPACMNGLGAIYNEGDGVLRNVRLARQWFEKAAALGDHEVQQNLAEMRR